MTSQRLDGRKIKHFTWSRHITQKLIELYRHQPCLYDSRSKDHHNRFSRQKALEKIAHTINERYHSSLTSKDIQNKLHGIRTQYMTEIRAIRRSQKTCTSPEDIYTPRLWCFDLLKFLNVGINSQEQSSIFHEIVFQEPILRQNIKILNREILSSELNQEIVPQEIPMLKQEILSDEQTETLEDETPEEIPVSVQVAETDDEIVFDSDKAEFENGTINSPAESNKSRPSSRLSEDGPKRRRIEPEREIGKSSLQTFVVDASSKLVNAVFGELIGREMETIKNEEILDNLKVEILMSLYKAKSDYRKLIKKNFY